MKAFTHNNQSRDTNLPEPITRYRPRFGRLLRSGLAILVAASTLVLFSSETANAATIRSYVRPSDGRVFHANGCGSNGISGYAPDSIPGVMNFRQACDNHDLCYGGYWGTSVSKATCDAWFYWWMEADCAPRNWFSRQACRGWRDTYYAAVHEFGGGAFQRARANYAAGN